MGGDGPFAAVVPMTQAQGTASGRSASEPPRPPWRLILLSADSLAELQAAQERLRTALNSYRSGPRLPAVSHFGFSQDRRPGRYRGALLFPETATGDADLTAASDRLRPAAVEHLEDRPVTLMFPGLGEQYLNMGLGLYRTEPIFQSALDGCAQILSAQVGLELKSALYPASTPDSSAAASGALDLRRLLGRSAEPADAATARLQRPELVQPALFVVEYALAQLLLSWGLRIDSLIGYSLGEYVAACLAGVLSLADALSLVALRAQLIAELPAGAMLAVALAEPEVQSLLGRHLSLAAVNSEDFCVVAGPPEAVQELEHQLRARAVVTRRVRSTHAFHSKMMQPIAERLTRLVRGYTLGPPRIPYISNVTGAPITAAQACDPSYFATHLCSPVRCADGFRFLRQTPARLFIESGPGQGLSSVAILQQPAGAPSADAGARATAVAMMRSAYDSQQDEEALLTGLGQLWLHGAPLSWERFPVHSPLRSPQAAAPAGGRVQVDAPAAMAAAAAIAEDAIATKIAAIWCELFRRPKVELTDHFLDLGGNSLLATRMALRLRKAFGVAVPLARILGAPTIAKLTTVVATLLRPGASPAAASRSMVPEADSSPAERAPRSRRLPNGLTVSYYSEAELQHFYHDIFEQRSYLRGGLTIADGACVFDVGANIGLFTLFAAQQGRGVKVYCFEPAPPLFALLQDNVRQNQIDAQLFNFGLASREETAQFTYYPQSSGMSSFYANLEEERQVLRAIIHNQQHAAMDGMAQVLPYSEEILDLRFAAQTFPCRLRRLSAVMREQGVAQIDLLKIDVQKAELAVLEGVDAADWPRIRQLAIEVHDLDGRLARMLALLAGHGYLVHHEQDPLYKGTNLHNIYARQR